MRYSPHSPKHIVTEILHWKLANQNYDLFKFPLVEEGNVAQFISFLLQKICNVLLLFVLNGHRNRPVLFSLGYFVFLYNSPDKYKQSSVNF